MKHLCRKKLHEMTPENTDQWGRCRSCRAIYRHDFYMNDKESEKMRSLRWNRHHPIRVKTTYTKYARTIKGRYSRLWKLAHHRGHKLSISFEQYQKLILNPCSYCGGSLPETGSGLDRISSDYGYIIGNVRTCCTACNRAKNSMTEQEFRTWLRRAYNYWGKKPQSRPS